MTKEFYGKDLARYKLDRALEELDTAELLAELLFENDKLKAANNSILLHILCHNSGALHGTDCI